MNFKAKIYNNEDRKKKKDINSFIRFLIHEYTVIAIIVINTLVLFFDEFPVIHKETAGKLIWIDYGCVVFFVFEAVLKIKTFRFKHYWKSAWDRFDFFVVIASLPSLLMPFVSDVSITAFLLFPLFRLGRLFRFFRLLRFIPNIQHIMDGIRRALRASVGIFMALVLLNLALSIGATMLFGKLAPEYFGDPLSSAYSLFKVFTVEGWYEIPDELADKGKSEMMIRFLRGYFIFSVLVGGLLGFSLANAVFVDEMTMDNTRKVENMVETMHREMEEMHLKTQQEQLAAWKEMQAEMKRIVEMMETMRKDK